MAARHKKLSRQRLICFAIFLLLLVPKLRSQTHKADAADSTPAIATSDYEVDGVEVAPLSVKRISDGSIYSEVAVSKQDE